MELIARRFRGVIIALVVLGLSASVAFAGHLTLAPVSQPTAAEQGDQDEQANENETDTEKPDADENDNESPDANEQSNEQSNEDSTASDNHGALVSTAAMMTEPDGFKNHGAFVSCVAHMKVAPTLAAGQTLEAFLAALTPADCVVDRGADTADATDGSTTEDTATDSPNHGALVSTAAQMADPEGFANHGEFVSCVARMKDLPSGMSIDQVLAAVTVDACRATSDAKTDAKTGAKTDTAHGKRANHKNRRHHSD